MSSRKIVAVVASLAALSIPAAAIAEKPADSSQTHPQTTNSPAVTTLMQAAQRLRDATHDLVRESDPQQRNIIISKIDKTLWEVQDAITSLPSNVLLAGVHEGDSKKAAGEMAKAADQLNAAAAKLRNDGSDQTRQSLEIIQKALAQVRQERSKIANSGGGGQTAAH